MPFVIIALLVSLGLAGPGHAQVSDNRLVVPGQRIGGWTLRMTIDDLVISSVWKH